MTIADAMIFCLQATERTTVWWGDCDLLDACAHRAGLYDRPGNTHPLAVHQRILRALDRHPAFHKAYIVHEHHRTRCFTYIAPSAARPPAL